MIQGLVDFALENKVLVLGLTLLLVMWGGVAFHNLPVEAYPDVADTWVQVITQWPGHAAEEVETLVTIPVEIQMNGVSHLTHMRSVSLFGLSVVTMLFDDDADNLLSRAQVLEKLQQVNLPTGLTPQMGPDYSPVGQIYWFTLKSTNPRYDLMELKTLMDWDVHKYLKSVPDVVDVSSFGGTTQEYQVQVDPNKLIEYGISLAQLEQALGANNINTGGSFIEAGEQALNVRVVGLFTNTDDIGLTLLKNQGGTPVRVRDVAKVVQGPKIRLGQIGRTLRRADGNEVVIEDSPDSVEGIVLLRKGAEPQAMLEGLHVMVDRLNNEILPKGVSIVPFLDRGDLVELTTHTVLHNLTEGILLVTVILFLFLGNLRSALIVALTIPFSLLFACICLDLRHIPANLLSLGALDFGMVVDGSVVMIENILRHVGRPAKAEMSWNRRISLAVHEVQRPVFFAIFIIITAYLPIFTLQRVEGRLFRPMAWTVAFALMGGLTFALLIAPILASLLFGQGMREWHNPVLVWLIRRYRRVLNWTFGNKSFTVAACVGLMAATLFLAFGGLIGSEFLPHLDEGAIWARGTLAPSTGPTEGTRIMHRARHVFASFPEVTKVVSQVGRPDDGTDSTGFFNTEYFVDLKPHEGWRPEFRTKEELISAMNSAVSTVPGVLWNFSQPIADNMEEAVSGVKGELAVKIYGTDLKDLERTGDAIVNVMKDIPGVVDLGLFRVVGQPNVNLIVDRAKSDRLGINVSDIQDAIEAAVGGKAVTQVLQGERRFDLVVRYQERYRRTTDDIGAVRILAPSGERVALSDLCVKDAQGHIPVEDGASMIYRETNSRYIAIKYGVRGRDLGSTVEEAMERVKQNVKLPEGYNLAWSGEYESKQRAEKRLMVVIPVTVLMIFLILYGAFHSLKWASLNMFNVAMGRAGGLLALFVTGTHFSVSSGVGFLALFGVSIQTGVIMVEYMHQLRARGLSIADAAREGAVARLRPIMMTMLVATLGLLPAATSHGIGSDSQRPFAIVIVGGLICDLVISLILLPTLYTLFARDTDLLPPAEGELELEPDEDDPDAGPGHSSAELATDPQG